MTLVAGRTVFPHAVFRYSRGIDGTRGTYVGKHRGFPANGLYPAKFTSLVTGLCHRHRGRASLQHHDEHDEHDKQQTPVMSQQKRVGGGGHAILHDFCLVIPYGLLLVLVGLIGVATPGAVKFGWLTAAAGLAQMFLSSKSLGSWKAGGNHRIFTSLCLGIAALLTWVSTTLFRRGAFPLVSGSAGVLSGAISLFLIHNLVAGGNKPPGQKSR